MVTLCELALSFLKIGAFGFGGPFSLLAIMHKEVVERRRWLTAEEYTQSVSIGALTPGPIFFAAAIFVGYRLRRVRGAIVAGLGSLLPSFLLVVAFAAFYLRVEQAPWVQALSRSIAAGVVGIFLSVVVKTGRSLAVNLRDVLVIVAVFVAVAFLRVDPILLILASGLLGAWLFQPRNVESG